MSTPPDQRAKPEGSEADLNRWLRGEGGYKYACFISWASKAGSHAKNAAHALKKRLTAELELEGWSDGGVYLAETDNEPGEDWYARMTDALCRSVTVVAICTPDYYESEHCRREWAGMAQLESSTCPGRILPLILREHRLPEAVRSRHLINDLMKLLLNDGWTRRNAFGKVADKVVTATRDRAHRLRQQDLKALVVELPHESPFKDFEPARKLFPFMETEE